MSEVKSANAILSTLDSDLVLARIMLAVVGTPREAAAAVSDPVVKDAVRRHLANVGSGQLEQNVVSLLEAYEDVSRGRTAYAARQLLELEGKRIRFRDVRVREEIAASARGERILHRGDNRGLLLHPSLVEALVGLADVHCYELGWLRATHGKYKTTAGEISQIDMDAEISPHFVGMGADFYTAGPTLDRLVGHDAGQIALDDALRPLVRAIWEGAVKLPEKWWIVMPPSLNLETPGSRAGVEFFSNDRHRNHLHIGLNN